MILGSIQAFVSVWTRPRRLFGLYLNQDNFDDASVLDELGYAWAGGGAAPARAYCVARALVGLLWVRALF